MIRSETQGEDRSDESRHRKFSLLRENHDNQPNNRNLSPSVLSSMLCETLIRRLWQADELAYASCISTSRATLADFVGSRTVLAFSASLADRRFFGAKAIADAHDILSDDRQRTERHFVMTRAFPVVAD